MNYLRFLVDRITRPFRVLLHSPLSLFNKPSRILGLSLPLRLALFALLVLVACVALSWYIFETGGRPVSYWSGLPTFAKIGVVVGLLLIPPAVYYATRLWLEGDPIPFEDIERAWAYGIKALQDHGIEIHDAPLFLVTGVHTDVQARALMHTTEKSFAVDGVPDGPAALHWFANEDAIYLVLTQVSQVGLLAQLAAQRTGKSEQAGAEPPQLVAARQRNQFMGTYAPPADDSGLQPGGETVIGEFGDASESRSAPSAHLPAYGRTLDDLEQFSEIPLRETPRSRIVPVAVQLTDAQIRDLRVKLRFLGNRLRYARQKYCPVNGIVNLLPFELIQTSEKLAAQVKRAALEDLDALNESLEVRCPVTAVISGMESESGFRELTRRIGREMAKSHRFGKGADPWTPPTGDYLEAVTRTATGAFEDWVYHLFSAGDGLSKPGNAKLYSLLCRIRTDLQERLVNIICGAYGRESDSKSGREAMLFSGCYFAATGQTEDRQAFIKSILVDKLHDEEGQVSWKSGPVASDHRYGFFAGLAIMVSLIEIALIIFLLLDWWGLDWFKGRFLFD